MYSANVPSPRRLNGIDRFSLEWTHLADRSLSSLQTMLSLYPGPVLSQDSITLQVLERIASSGSAGLACPSVSFYVTAVIKVFCLCDSADRRSAARPGSAATACHFFLPRLLHDTRDVRCSVCLSALHFAHQRARQQQGRQPRPRRRRGTATTRPPLPPRSPHPPHSSHPPRLPRSPPVVRRAFRTRVAARPCLRLMCFTKKGNCASGSRYPKTVRCFSDAFLEPRASFAK